QGGSAQAAGFTGTQIAAPAGNLEDAANAVTVVGGALANPDALQAALDAYREPAASSLPLPDHLLRALEAVSAANGVALCNQNGITQTASTAFILVAHSGDSAFRTMTLGVPAQKEAQPPWLALSVKLPRGGRNAVGVLREEYEQWRPAHLPPCVECNLAPIAVPAGGTLTTPPNAWVQTNGLCLITVFILVIALLTTLWFTLRPHPAPRAPLSPDA
ncbi:MAG TPA: hypothetical protein VFD70_17035, partial [Anaerolineae bacterium]|nr:hypothetical protein [Anaerolineae bacterium]